MRGRRRSTWPRHSWPTQEEQAARIKALREQSAPPAAPPLEAQVADELEDDDDDEPTDDELELEDGPDYDDQAPDGLIE